MRGKQKSYSGSRYPNTKNQHLHKQTLLLNLALGGGITQPNLNSPGHSWYGEKHQRGAEGIVGPIHPCNKHNQKSTFSLGPLDKGHKTLELSIEDISVSALLLRHTNVWDLGQPKTVSVGRGEFMLVTQGEEESL